MIRTLAWLQTLAAVILLGAVGTSPALAQPGPVIGRLYGHLPYGEAIAASLTEAPAGFAVGQKCEVKLALVPDLSRMIAAIKAAHLGAELRGVSCFRSLAHQERVFCEARRADHHCVDPVNRARSVAPPGHSEHATGYAIDFGVRPEGDCADVEPCFAATAIGRWLILNAPDYGFELSFPKDNRQGVTWEPWHWRWVGTSNAEPGALAARKTFARARTQFPASPRVATIVIRVIAQPPLPDSAVDPAPALSQPPSS